MLCERTNLRHIEGHSANELRVMVIVDDYMSSKYPARHSLKIRLTVFILFILLLVIWSLSYFITRSLQADMERVLGDQQLSSASFVAAEVNQELHDRLISLELIAREISPELMRRPEELQKHLQQRPILELLFSGGTFITTLDGTAVADMPRSSGRVGTSFMDREYVLAAIRDGKTSVGRPVVGKKRLVPLISITVPIRTAQGHVLGALVGVTDLGKSNFLDKISQTPHDNGSYTLLVDRGSRLVVSASDSRLVMKNLSPVGAKPLLDQFIAGYEGSGIMVNALGQEVLASAKGIPLADWYVAEGIPTDKAFVPIRNLVWRIQIATSLLTLLACGVTWLVLRRMLNPLVETANAMTALASSAQNLQPLALSHRGEIGQLVEGFNRLLHTWTEREAALLQSEQNLAITLNSIGDAVIATDTEGRITRMNPAAEALTGWSMAEAKDRMLSEVFCIINAETRQPAVNPVQLVKTRGETVGMTNHTTLLARHGGEYQIADSAAPIRNASSDIVGVVLVFSDISEKYQTELALRQSEARYRSLLDNLSSGVVVHHADTSILLSNAMAAVLLGLTQDQMLGKAAPDPGWSFLRDDSTPMPLEEYPVNLVLLSGEPLKNYVIGIRHAGRTEPTWVICNAYPVRDDAGTLIQAVVTFTDITARKRVEQQLRESNALTEAIVENIPLMVFLKDAAELRFLAFNRAGEELVGYERQTFLGKNDLDLFPPEQASHFMADDRKVLDGDDQVLNILEESIQTGKKGIRLLHTRKVCIRGEDGNTKYLLGISEDITERKLAEEERQHQHELLRNILDTALDGYWLVDTQGKLQDVNEAACAMLGYTKQEALVLHVSDIDLVDSPQVVESRVEHMKIHGGDSFESRHRRKDGSIIDVEVSIRHLPQRDAFSVFLRNITQRKHAEAKLQLAASVFDHSREGITITDAHGTIVDVNEAFTRITGYAREEAIGQNPRILKSGRQDAAFYAAMWNSLLESGHWSGEIWNRRKGGEVYASLVTISAIKDADNNTQQYVALFSDITGIKEHQKQLEHIANFDGLTNLPNRLLLADRLQQAMAQAQRRGRQVAVAFLDLDGFKVINDQQGHDAGDHLLVSLANAMKATLRDGDTLARIGGDEFVAVLIDVDGIEGCAPMLARLLETASAPVRVGNAVLQGSVSIGVTFYPQAHEIEADQLLRQADQAMYQAKLAGKNRYHVFDAVHDNSVRFHHERLERMRLALARREFVLYYQPKVNMRTGQVVGAEALIRWQHPQQGLLPPGSFLPIIEDHPLAVEVGEWVIDTALTQIERWHATGLVVNVSVNIGARQLQQGNFVQRLREVLALHPQVSPTCLELEVLETSALADMQQVSQVIEDCQAMGVNFALDDFGTGYSSLTYLKRLRAATLKIDQSFVRDMLDDPDDLAILEGVIGLAAAFKREVIAEGVETVAHGAALLNLGCELAQGYGIARPMPAELLPRWTASWRPDDSWSYLRRRGGNPHSENG